MIAVKVNYTFLHTREGNKVPGRMIFQTETFDDATRLILHLIDSFDDIGYELTSTLISTDVEEVAKYEG